MIKPCTLQDSWVTLQVTPKILVGLLSSRILMPWSADLQTFSRYAILENDFSFHILDAKLYKASQENIILTFWSCHCGSAQQQKASSERERGLQSEQQTRVAAEEAESKAQHLLKWPSANNKDPNNSSLIWTYSGITCQTWDRQGAFTDVRTQGQLGTRPLTQPGSKLKPGTDSS